MITPRPQLGSPTPKPYSHPSAQPPPIARTRLSHLSEWLACRCSSGHSPRAPGGQYGWAPEAPSWVREAAHSGSPPVLAAAQSMYPGHVAPGGGRASPDRHRSPHNEAYWAVQDSSLDHALSRLAAQGGPHDPPPPPPPPPPPGLGSPESPPGLSPRGSRGRGGGHRPAAAAAPLPLEFEPRRLSSFSLAADRPGPPPAPPPPPPPGLGSPEPPVHPRSPPAPPPPPPPRAQLSPRDARKEAKAAREKEAWLAEARAKFEEVPCHYLPLPFLDLPLPFLDLPCLSTAFR